MADHNNDNATDVAFQRFVTTLLLNHIGSAGFALAGSGAIREHGITDRLTRDVDLFTTAATSPAALPVPLPRPRTPCATAMATESSGRASPPSSPGS